MKQIRQTCPKWANALRQLLDNQFDRGAAIDILVSQTACPVPTKGLWWAKGESHPTLWLGWKSPDVAVCCEFGWNHLMLWSVWVLCYPASGVIWGCTSTIAMGGFGGLSPPKQSSKHPPNENMKHYKSMEFLLNLNVKPPA